MGVERFTYSDLLNMNRPGSVNIDWWIGNMQGKAKQKHGEDIVMVNVVYCYLPLQLLITLIFERTTP